ncbi:PLDc N-terminal domain-containing protein [Paramicrobacterium chengjingii]|uniref:PLDc N-terminal domain-containing protein n=1 Tax=Paramicrobacterium chengjingii TaxID=2769067 RepID=UPI00141D7D83|nr:PLDc N-terminal domain-containing protein [Microbacterium chengjingii]
MDVFVAVAVGAAAFGTYLAALAYAVAQVWGTPELTSVEKSVWAVAIIFFPMIGCIAWFAAGAHRFGLRLTHDLK